MYATSVACDSRYESFLGTIEDCTMIRMRRRLQKILGKIAMLLTLCMLAMVVMNVFTVMTEEFRQRYVDMRDKAEIITRRRQRPSERYDVMISSYMNSGSSFTANMLGLRADAFYFYEPLWHVAPWDYYRTNTTTCSMRFMACRTLTEKNMNRNAPAVGMPVDFTLLHDKDIMERALPILVPLRIMEHVYNCDISKLQNVIRPDVTVKFSGASWDHYNYCISKRYRREECLRKLELKCLTAKHRTAKVLRLTPAPMDLLLSKFPRLKIVHLFRDPRAIINSRIETNGYPLYADSALVQINARVLCDKIGVDLRQGIELKKKFPKRFFFAHYEDLFTNDSSLVWLHEEFGMDLSRGDMMRSRIEKRNKAEDLREGQVRERQTNNAFWWRENLPYNLVTMVDKVCRQLYDQLGYPNVLNSDDLKKYNATEIVNSLAFKL